MYGAEPGVSVSLMGRLSRPPNPTLFRLVYGPQLASDRSLVLPYLLRIDAAHVVMLDTTRLLKRDVAAALLRVNREIAVRFARGHDVLGSPATHRGLYMLYEQHCTEHLGKDAGGAAHVARSRNDINATVARMRLREEMCGLLLVWCALLDAVRSQADRHRETVMAGFTHLQPAQPTSFGHYLAGVTSELVRSAEWLADTFDCVNCSPMGAAAGFGTSFAVDPVQVAELLGFRTIIENSADAVASRDYLVRVLSALAVLGTSITRFATDLQAWSSAAYGFLDWPDDLVSTSSIMPQKRNVFVLETIRGEAIHSIGALVNTLAGMKNAPFSNSVEVSGEATGHVWPALSAGRKALELLTLMVQQIEIRPARMRAFLGDAGTTMTAVADLLVARHGLGFRVAHEAVAKLAAEPPGLSAAEAKARLEIILRDAGPEPVIIDEAALAIALDPEGCVRRATYGGGPAPETVRRQLQGVAHRLEQLRARISRWQQQLADADARLDAAADAICESRSLGEGLDALDQ
jgi:argininosuccinate lyase